MRILSRYETSAGAAAPLGSYFIGLFACGLLTAPKEAWSFGRSVSQSASSTRSRLQPGRQASKRADIGLGSKVGFSSSFERNGKPFLSLLRSLARSSVPLLRRPFLNRCVSAQTPLVVCCWFREAKQVIKHCNSNNIVFCR